MLLHLMKTAVAFWVGYTTVTKVAPFVQAKVEALALDDAWDVFNEEIDD